MKGPKEETNVFYRCETVRETFWFFDLSLKNTLPLQKLKGMQGCKNWYVKGIPFVIVRYMKGGPFLSKMMSKREWGWILRGTLHV